MNEVVLWDSDTIWKGTWGELRELFSVQSDWHEKRMAGTAAEQIQTHFLLGLALVS